MQTYEAILISTSANSQSRDAGILSFDATNVYFKSDEKQWIMPFHGLKVTLGGAGEKLIFFQSTNYPDFSVYTSDHKVLKNEFLLANSAILPQVKQVKSRKTKLAVSFLSVLGIFLALIVSLVLMKSYFVRKIAEKAPVSWEKKIGDKLFQGLSMQYTFIKNDSLKAEFMEVAKPLLRQIEKDGVKVDIYFTKDPTVNAFALPGGKVIIQSGLIEKAHSWEEVLGVLGHELAHVTQRHHLRGVIENLGLYTIISVFFGDISALAGTLANTGGELASLANSREFETEADEVGLHYLVAAKINADGLIDFFETLKKEHKNPLEKELSFLSTHPATDDRIDDLKMLKKEIPPYKAMVFKTSFSNFQKRMNLL